MRKRLINVEMRLVMASPSSDIFAKRSQAATDIRLKRPNCSPYISSVKNRVRNGDERSD